MLIFLAVVFVVATACSLAGGASCAASRRRAALSSRRAPTAGTRAPTPTMGGIAIAAATIVGLRGDCAARRPRWTRRSNGLPVPLGALAMFVVGILDDRLQLSPVAKLVASLAIGAFLVFALAGSDVDGALPSAVHARRRSCGLPASATR